MVGKWHSSNLVRPDRPLWSLMIRGEKECSAFRHEFYFALWFSTVQKHSMGKKNVGEQVCIIYCTCIWRNTIFFVSFLIISAVCNIPQKSFPQCATYRGDHFRGVHNTAEKISLHTTETISAVVNTPRRSSAQCATYRGDKLLTA